MAMPSSGGPQESSGTSDWRPIEARSKRKHRVLALNGAKAGPVAGTPARSPSDAKQVDGRSAPQVTQRENCLADPEQVGPHEPGAPGQLPGVR